MPYIPEEERKLLDKIVEVMVTASIKANGDLNYILFKFCKYHIQRSYNSYKNYCSELRQCATEIERSILGPYEDRKKIINGDV